MNCFDKTEPSEMANKGDTTRSRKTTKMLTELHFCLSWMMTRLNAMLDDSLECNASRGK